MDASHILVGGLTAISLALLVWMEIRSRRNARPNQSGTLLQPAQPKDSRHRTKTAGAEDGNHGRMDADCGTRAGSDDSCTRWLHVSARSLPEVPSAFAR